MPFVADDVVDSCRPRGVGLQANTQIQEEVVELNLLPSTQFEYSMKGS